MQKIRVGNDILQFPDDMDDNAIKAVIQREYGNPQAMPTQEAQPMRSQFSDTQDPTADNTPVDRQANEAKARQQGFDNITRGIYSIPAVGGVVKAFDDVSLGGSQLLARGVDALTFGNTNLSKTYDKEVQKQERLYNEANPANAKGYFNDASRIAGSVMSGGTGSIAGGALKNIAIGAGIGTATSPVLQEKGQEGNQSEFAKQKAIQLGIGAGLGGLGVGANKAIGALRRSNTPIKTSEQIKGLSSQAFKLADDQGANIQPWETNLLIDKVNALEKRSNWAKTDTALGLAEDFKKRLTSFKDKPFSFNDLQDLDEELTQAINSQYGIKGVSKDGYKLQEIQDEVRDWVDNLDFSGNDKQGLQTLKTARALYSQSMKLRDIESILQRAEGADQPIKSIQTAFGNILNNPKKRRGYSKQELNEMQKIYKSNVGMDVIRQLGSRLVGIIGTVGSSPVRALSSIAGSTTIRGIGGKLQRNRALDVADMIASRDINAPKNIKTTLLDNQIKGITDLIKDVKKEKPVDASYDFIPQKEITPEEKLNIKDDQLKTYSGYDVDTVLNVTRNKKTTEGSRYQKRPLTEALMETGVDPQSKIAKELAHMGITPKTTIGLFKKGGRKDLDNLDYSEYQHMGLKSDGQGYVDRDSILERLRQEQFESVPIKDKGRSDLEDDLMFLGLSNKPKKRELISKLKNEKIKELSDPTLGRAGQPMQDMPDEYFSSLVDNVKERTSKINDDAGLSTADKIKRFSGIRSQLVRLKKDLIKNNTIPKETLKKNINFINSAIVATQASRMTGQAMNAMSNKQNTQEQRSVKNKSINDYFKEYETDTSTKNKSMSDYFKEYEDKPQTQYQFKRPDFVNDTTQAESSGNPNAVSKVKGSTASGLAGFIDTTWNDMQKKYGKQYGLNNKADPYQQQIATDLYAQDNEKYLKQKLKNRVISNKDLHVAHFMGANGATRMILNMQRGQGDKLAYQTFRKEANKNKPVFFDGNRPRTINEVYAILASRGK